MSLPRRIGAHLPAAGGYPNAITKALEIGANTVQIFSGTPRVWARPPVDPQRGADLKAAAEKADVLPVTVHALYLVNVASDNPESVAKSWKALEYDFLMGKHFDCSGVVVHLGSHQGRGWETVRDQVASGLKSFLEKVDSDVPFLIENSAGQKGKLCSDLREIRWLLDTVDHPQLGWCYDTCHGWAAGYSVTQPQSPEFDLFNTLEELNLWGDLRCVHFNDSRDLQGSGRDRHANIGEGNVPPEDMKAILNHPKLTHVPFITEAPGLDGNGPDKANIDRIRGMLQN
jgi:deoxyribonuclease-4